MLNRINLFVPGLLLKPRYRWMRHFLIILVALLITVTILWDDPVAIRPDRIGAWGLYFFLFTTIVYINRYLLVPRFLLKGKNKQYILLTFLMVLFLILSIGLLQSPSEEDAPINRTPALIGISSGVAALLLFIAGLTTIQLLKYRLENKRRIKELENATMAIELANLQAQINPHFLFNMLNNAHIMAGQDREKSSLMLARLHALLRYQIENGSKPSVKLMEDVAFFEEYLELEKMRRDRFSFTIDLTGDLDLEVPPLLFIPFIENAVKHNPENDSYVALTFQVKNNSLCFCCKNPKPKMHQPKNAGGIGLANIKRRLELLFNGTYTLELRDEEDTYTAELKISLLQVDKILGNEMYYS